ncbi:xanthotoxin 5-hydroxylase CYP82C4-like isoform X2 [Ipomoea triloba]|uniref:xanthotoxin 5-hydroxylase CYP82C4-like isoform X2 n=1 Tax=Ipomoea triloba TaxID=35885 RepID=UPI00125CE934|nr:xanthotoxin 5-hydroxylase CYP82C4-like isoform X2 [Ipomoea triloba]
MDAVSCLSSVLGIATLVLVWFSWRKQSKRLPPEASGAWPIVGHLHHFRTSVPLVKTLSEWADKYGPVFTIRLGISRILVVSSWEAVRDCFATNDKLLAARPTTCAGKYLGYDYAVFTFSTNNSYWRRVRKLVVVELLSSRRLEKLKHVWVSELQTNIKELYTSVSMDNNNHKDNNLSAPKVNMSRWFGHLTLNLIMQIVAGRRYEYRSDGVINEEALCLKNVFRQVMYLWGEFVSGDAIFPLWFFRWLDYEGHVKSMKKAAKEVDAILQDWVDVRRKEMRSNEDQKFIDVMLSMIDDQFTKGYNYSRDTVIKAIVLSMLQDASETFASHLTWILAVLLKHPESLKRVQEEIDTNIGKERWAEDHDIKNLPYLQAVVKETLRIYPPGPYLAPHEAVKDCIVDDYHIPKGTQLYVNVWRLHRDPKIWSDPEKFLPERFMTNLEGEAAQNRQYQFVPFGLGRRSCPGMLYATQITHVAVARLFQGFNFSTVPNVPLDMTEGGGITLPKLTPLEVLVTPRLTPALFGL